MSLVVKNNKSVDIIDFCVSRAMQIEIKERDKAFWENNISRRYYANIQGLFIIDGNFLKGSYGDGATPQAAVKDYCKEISGKKVSVNTYLYSYDPIKLQFTIPILTCKNPLEFTGVI